ncbi:MAG: S8 family peptidase [Ignavibacteriae bacterium]|nr:S8 family peptidase [Ignavibacteriota bacterium]
MKIIKSQTAIIFFAISFFTIFTLLGSNNFSYQYKISNQLLSEFNVSQDNSKFLVWIEFKDKGSNVNYLLSHPELYLSGQAIERRKKVKPMNALIDYTDIPLNGNYISQLKDAGIDVKNRSKWFNRVSCYATRTQIENIVSEDYINRVDLVLKFKKNYDNAETLTTAELFDKNFNENSVSYQLNYGNSLEQMELINAPIAHDSGYHGEGVLIASFDTGVDNLGHPAFDSIRARGLRTYDFVNHDTNVANENGQMGEGSHGTATLSLVGGYKPGNLISPAFRSKFIIAKTENTDSETPLEEDNWIAAAEWADSLGADIITSSLGYLDMDPGSTHSYDWTWMNGDSCVITIGADLAVNKGIIVCNSAGNNGYNSTHNTLLAPSDGDSVICVGSIKTNKRRSSFSSVGLTVDGRIKPDVCAFGDNNYAASPGAGNTGYSTGSGTSFSCPMTAGACAIILSANRNLTPMQVRELLRTTADSAFAPNRERGWGLINTWEAVKLAKNLTSINNTGNNYSSQIEGYDLFQNIPNPFNPETVISYNIPESGNVLMKVYNMQGREVATLINENQGKGNYSRTFNAGNLSSGVYFYTLLANGKFIGSKRMLLLK